MVGWGLLLFSVWGYTKLISRPVWQGMRMWFNCSWLKVLLPRPTSGESSGWPPPCIIFFGVSSIATKALLIEETQEIWSFINFDVSSGLQVSRVERHFETSCVLSGEIQWSHDIPWMNATFRVLLPCPDHLCHRYLPVRRRIRASPEHHLHRCTAGAHGQRMTSRKSEFQFSLLNFGQIWPFSCGDPTCYKGFSHNGTF